MESLMDAIDEIKDKYGEFSVTRGSILYRGHHQNIIPFGSGKQRELKT
jgi:hypothetical protein